MKEKGILKLNVADKQRTMNYTTEDDKIYMLTSSGSQKVKDLMLNRKATLLLDDEEIIATATIIRELDSVKEMYDKMTSEKNNHFKQMRDDLILLEFSK